uniref:Glutamyl-tRNA(Gln) amidotransferase subunit A, mitochondrial n=1 Tax=Parascaris univalens TaxID=6257 RepID=A0A914ZGW5_PARUN
DEMERIEKAIESAIRFRKYNALITETFDLACSQAESALRRNVQPFPVVVKDCFTINGQRTTCASKMLANFIAPYTATVVARLIESGGCIIGKSNMDEFCMGTSSSQSVFGAVKNALSNEDNLDIDWLIPGGSSGGSAVAVQLDIADVGLGSDTGGSTRNPAAFTGLFGFKPSYGVLSRYGLIPLVNSLDCPSIIARSAKECNNCFKAMSGRDKRDSTSVDSPQSCFMQHRKLDGITIGIPLEYHNRFLTQDCWEAWNNAAQVLVKLGCRLKEISMPHTEYSIICYHVLAEADIASNMARYDGVAYGHRSKDRSSTHSMYASSRSEALNEVVRRRIFAGNYFLMKRHYDEYFLQALRVRRLIKGDFDHAFKDLGCDALLTPVTCGVPPYYSEINHISGYERERIDDFFTQPANMAGVPAIAVPFMETAEKLPVAVQIMTDYLNDGLALDIADCLYHS